MNDTIELTYTDEQLDIFFNIPENIKYMIITKGRRFGATRGGTHACIEWLIEGKKILWGDTVSTNIDRYFERYFVPALKANGIDYYYTKQDKKLIVGNGYVDFRSADRPENWEGFGYDYIFLNEAGIILNNKYLYTNAVLPMLIDSPNSKLIAAGVPKGKYCKGASHKGEEHPFYTLYKLAKNKNERYLLHEYTSYDNGLLPAKEIKELELEIARMSPTMVDQEIYGRFVDSVSGVLWTADLFKHFDKLPELEKIIIGVDPSGSKNGDEVGIVTAGKDFSGYIYVIKDNSGGYTPYQWGNTVASSYHNLKADRVAAERNYGGDMVKSTIQNVDKTVRVTDVTATRGKEVRAEPVLALYEQGMVYHMLGLNKLENEMLTWVPGVSKSPNRIDALVWAITELSLQVTKNWVL